MASGELVLVDSSVWIDYLRAADSRATAEIDQLVDTPDRLTTTEPVMMELLAGFTSPHQLAEVERLVAGLALLEVEPQIDYRAAAGIYRSVRRSGHPVRQLNDCLIAAIAVRCDVELLHKDVDFEVIASCVTLRHRSLL